jgi:hypothetical protein
MQYIIPLSIFVILGLLAVMVIRLWLMVTLLVWFHSACYESHKQIIIRMDLLSPVSLQLLRTLIFCVSALSSTLCDV